MSITQKESKGKQLTIAELTEAGVHYGHLSSKWDPRMSSYIFMKSNDIHIIDLNKTLQCLSHAASSLKNIVKSGRRVMFVGTKKQAKNIIKEKSTALGMPYVTERWLGGTLTNFATIRKSLRKLEQMEKKMKDDAFENLAKRERLIVTRERASLERLLGGISELTRLPAALFVVDIKREYIAVLEAQKLNIPVYAMVDTNSNPSSVDFPIPSNDDAFKSISLIINFIGEAIQEGLDERKKESEIATQKAKEEKEKKFSKEKVSETS